MGEDRRGRCCPLVAQPLHDTAARRGAGDTRGGMGCSPCTTAGGATRADGALGWHGQGHPLQPLIAPTPVGLHEDARRSHLCLAEPCTGLGTRGAQKGFKARAYPTPSDAVWTHSSPHPRGVKHSNPLGKKISCNSPRAQSCKVLSTPSQGMILEGNHPPLSLRCCLCPGGGHGQFRCLRTIGAVVPAGHASRCCRLPGTGSALTWEKRIQTRSLTLQTPSASHYPAASDAGSPGPAATQDGPSHTAPSNNFSSVPSLARQPPQLGARRGFRSSEKPLCVCLQHPWAASTRTAPGTTSGSGQPCPTPGSGARCHTPARVT